MFMHISYIWVFIMSQHYPEYRFEYSVKDDHTHDFKTQHEQRNGDHVSGFYSLVEPDGNERIVHYQADDHHG